MLKRLRVLFVAVVVLGALLAAAAPALAVHRPTKVMIVVMDQMKPGYAKQFNMKNVLMLQNKGATFPNAYLGHMEAATVISHNVMVSGLLPKHMGWSDELFRDVDNILGYGENALVMTGDLGAADFAKLIENMDYPKLGDYLHAKFPGKIVACVGEKGYQVDSMAASSSDYWVRFGSKKKTADLADPSVLPWSGTYRGAGGNPPPYIASDNRFMVSVGNSSDTYGTASAWPSWLYPEDGRMVPGTIAGHESGDNWVADATTAIMEHEDWSGLFVNFGAIDKIGHMWGGGRVDTVANYNWDPSSIVEDMVHMPFAAKNADDQLGKLIAKLKELNQFDDTLIVVTSDHGALTGENFYGEDALNAGNANWYTGTWFPGPITSLPGQPSLQPLMATGNVAVSYNDTSIHTWLVDRTGAKKREAAAAIGTLPGVIATYVKNGDRYRLYSSSADMTVAERAWWSAHGQELVDTMCFSGSADVVGLLADNTSYGAFGDHSGAQKEVQRVPMVFYAQGMKHAVSKVRMRCVDIMPTILKNMGITPTEPMDGSAYSLKLPK